MKKIGALVIAGVMAAAMVTTAFAAEVNQATTVTYTVAPTYTVIIPTTVTLTETTSGGKISYEGSGIISTGDKVRLNNKEYIKVVLNSDLTMESKEGATEPYQIFLNKSDVALTNNAVVSEFGTLETKQANTLNYVAGDPTFAGTYSDTVTFGISIATK